MKNEIENLISENEYEIFKMANLLNEELLRFQIKICSVDKNEKLYDEEIIYNSFSDSSPYLKRSFLLFLESYFNFLLLRRVELKEERINQISKLN